MTLRINQRTFFYVFMFLMLLRPSGLVQVLGVSRITAFLNIACIALVLLLTIGSKNLQLSMTNIMYILYLAWLLFASVIARGGIDNVENCLLMVLRNVGIVLFINYMCQHDIDCAVQAMFNVFFFLIILNFFAILLYPQGMYNYDQYDLWGRGYWLFGHANATITYVLPAICISVLYGIRFRKLKNRVLATILIGISIASVFIIQSATSILGIVTLLVVWCLLRYRLLQRLFKVKRAVLIGLMLCAGIVVFQIQYYFSDFIENVLNRSVTFTGRTQIWERSLQIISDNIFVGVGYHSSDYWSSVILAPSSHNEYLFALVQGGIVLFIIFLSVFYSAGRTLAKYSNTVAGKIFVAVIFSLLVQFVAETHMHRIAALIGIIGCADMLCQIVSETPCNSV